ncbi:MAG: type I-C CRISPR-associated protein Cas5c [Elusimicrobiota bacterium]|jgi:CRISPR-associated protein Cas5d|nr:type I-C CRISPR-associated protein Cas5c [Elusimicrobiota bacterium]
MFDTPKNSIEYKVWARNALFTDPITKVGGEKCSYQVPTYEAIKGITKSIYWKPTFIWIIDEVRIMKKIEMETKGIRPINYNGGNDLSIYTFLKNVEYRVRAHFEWNECRDDLKQDRNEGKHFEITKRSIAKGGRQDIFLGTRDCQGYVEPCNFKDDKGDYDELDLVFGMMFHGFDYPNESGTNEIRARLWNARMEKGVIKFPNSKNCAISKKIKTMQAWQDYEINKNFLGIDDEFKNTEAII